MDLDALVIGTNILAQQRRHSRWSLLSRGQLEGKALRGGRYALYSYVEERRIDHRLCGKIIVANAEATDEALETIAEYGRLSGASRLERLDRAPLAEFEPAVRADRGMLSPTSFSPALVSDSVPVPDPSLSASG